MQKTIDFNITLPLHLGKKLKHLYELSYYDNNYYELEEYGDYINFFGNNILKQEYCEAENCYTYSLGKFVDDKFMAVINWTITEDIIEEVKGNK